MIVYMTIIYSIIILYHTLYILIELTCHQRDHVLQVQFAAHSCVLINHHLLQNFMGNVLLDTQGI